MKTYYKLTDKYGCTCYYKLTDKHGCTYGGSTQWVPGTVITRGLDGPCVPVEMCSAFAVHAYTSPELGMMLTPLHNSFVIEPRCFEVYGEVLASDWDKVAAPAFVCGPEVQLPNVTMEMRVKFAIYCVQAVIKNACLKWSQWAERWLSEESCGYTTNPANADRIIHAAVSAIDALNTAQSAAIATRAGAINVARVDITAYNAAFYASYAARDAAAHADHIADNASTAASIVARIAKLDLDGLAKQAIA
jgi:hypothetical protein